ncbi:MAG: hypothetical protein Q7R82_00370 [Candidatus Daviesbacteria bacterium]|nr:hypothetical protein [Candidatus Daviesbacteria bacterium]
MTNNDLSQISKLLDEKLTVTEKRLKTEIAATEKRFYKRLTDTEKRLKSDITAAVTDSGNNIIEEIAGFMEVNILPRLEEKVDKSDIESIERKLDHVNDKIGEHDVRIKDIESIPVIAH